MTELRQIEVGIRNKRKHTFNVQNITNEEDVMSKQAKTFTANEIRRVLDFVATRKHALRNRAMVLITFYCGLRAKEVANLTYADVLTSENTIKSEIRLDAEQTKGHYGRVLFVNEKLKKELQAYITATPYKNLTDKLFYTQKHNDSGFTANTCAQFFHFLYKKVGIEGASSHSGRRTFITNLASKGVGVRVLMALAGHRNITTTQAYIDVNDDMKRSAVELI
jgi:integrase/recombinase XerD